MENPGIVSHVSVGVTDFGRAAAFYDAALGALGARRVLDFPGMAAWGRAFPEFWIGPPHDGRPPAPGNGVHVAFLAATRDDVDAFWKAGLAHGGSGDGAPGLRPHYGPGYYACFLRDPDGNKVEAHVREEGAGSS